MGVRLLLLVGVNVLLFTESVFQTGFKDNSSKRFIVSFINIKSSSDSLTSNKFSKSQFLDLIVWYNEYVQDDK
jgi:hypothetical protein